MIYVITGQTATGKTEYALKLAQKHNGELINADARQIYKYLNIITGKDLHLTTCEFTLWKQFNAFDIGFYTTLRDSNIKRPATKIWLYDVLQPSRVFSAYDYAILASKVIHDIQARGKNPIIVGGTFFYIQQLLYGVSEYNIPPNTELRQSLSTSSVEELQQLLQKYNSPLYESLNNSEKYNKQRLIRKIEIEMYMSSTNGVSKIKSTPIKDTCSITGFAYSIKDDLYHAIAKRVEKRLQNGAIEEVQQLLAAGFTQHDPGMKTIGYTQIINYLNNTITVDQMKEQWVTKEIQYAKRQLTLMKKDQHIQWKIV